MDYFYSAAKHRSRGVLWPIFTPALIEGLVPQSDAAYRATLRHSASNREPFIHVLSYFTDLLSLKLEYAQTLVDHEAALAHLDTLTGATLR